MLGSPRSIPPVLVYTSALAVSQDFSIMVMGGFLLLQSTSAFQIQSLVASWFSPLRNLLLTAWYDTIQATKKSLISDGAVRAAELLTGCMFPAVKKQTKMVRFHFFALESPPYQEAAPVPTVMVTQ